MSFVFAFIGVVYLFFQCCGSEKLEQQGSIVAPLVNEKKDMENSL